MVTKQTIVLARLVEDIRVVSTAGYDLGRRPQVEKVLVPKTAMWLRRGTEADVAKARQYAATAPEGEWRVFVYPTAERDPLGRAKRDILAT